MTADPRVVFGMPAYNRPDTLARTFESLLSQTYADFAIVMVDDGPSPAVRAIVETYSALFPRITYEPNPTRLGMVWNWRKAFERSRATYPDSDYFAWASDHDIWHPRWLEVLVRALDSHPSVVLAYPQVHRIYANSRRRVTGLFDTVGMTRRQDRLRLAVSTMTAGNGVYGLFRAPALVQAGVFRPVLLPDLHVLTQLSLLGEFEHVPEVLWYREVSGEFSYKRQREMCFPGRAPLHTYLPPVLQHCGILLWDLGVRGRGRPAFGRLAGAWYAALQLWYTMAHEFERSTLGRWLSSGRGTRRRTSHAGEAVSGRGR